MKDETSIENFRLLITEEYISKGIVPPEEGSSGEKDLYERWLRGREFLAQQ